MNNYLWLLLCAVALLNAAEPKHYACPRTDKPPEIDGKLDDAAWQTAPWTDWFIDIEGDAKPAPRFHTRVKMLWDDQNLYIGAELEKPDVSATLREHDSVIFHDNDFEVFLNPTGDGLKYFEFEINALNTSWDLFLLKPYREGGKADNSWEIPGLRSAVWIDGTLNDSAGRDRGWTVELAFPWTAFTPRSGKGRPSPGTEWRINFSRVEWNKERPGSKEDNWVWSPQGLINMHVPARWGVIRFN